MRKLELPLSRAQIHDLKIGDYVTISGTLITARDAAHQYLCQADPPEFREILKGAFIYHCGPIARKSSDHWEWIAAGPTTSMRMDPYTPTMIERYNIAGIIGKGGMGPLTQSACREFGAIYCQAPGGCAALLTRRVTKVKDVYKLNDFGMPEAIWVLEVKDFPVLVTMDSHGENLYKDIQARSRIEQEKME